MTDKSSVTVFGVECVDRYGNGRYTGELESGDEIAWQEDWDGRCIISLWSGDGMKQIAVASGETIEDAQREFIRRTSVALGAISGLFRHIGGES